jgi:hypothetical protein
LDWLAARSVVISRDTDAPKERTLNRRIISVTGLIVLATTSPASLAVAQAPLPAAATAQASNAIPSKAASSVNVEKAVGPTMAASKVGVSRSATASAAPAAADARLGAGRNVALMVVGGAALVIGLVIGGSAGVLIAVAGAAIGLLGLYYFVQ